MSSVPRDPEHYHPTIHAKDQRRHRGIDWLDVSEAIQEGEIRNSHEPECKLFVHECGHAHPVGVVANVETGEIVTVEFRK